MVIITSESNKIGIKAKSIKIIISFTFVIITFFISFLKNIKI